MLRLTYADGNSFTFDFAPILRGRKGVFAPLHDPTVFAQVAVDSEADTIVWPSGVDIDPDVLYALATGASWPVPADASHPFTDVKRAT
jgi:hypothetical protein